MTRWAEWRCQQWTLERRDCLLQVCCSRSKERREVLTGVIEEMLLEGRHGGGEWSLVTLSSIVVTRTGMRYVYNTREQKERNSKHVPP